MTVYSKRGLLGYVADALGRRIVSGELAEGATLDLEAVEADFSVSRTVVREAVKVLTAKGLLDARPHKGTFVLPRKFWNLLDADVMVWRGETGVSRQLLTELDELRRMVEPWAARMAAQRRTETQLQALQDAYERMVAADELDLVANSGTQAENVLADVEFHTALLRATGNELVAHMDVMLQPLLGFRDSLIPSGEQDAYFLDGHEAVLVAVRDQNSNQAEQAMHHLLESGSADVNRVVLAVAE